MLKGKISLNLNLKKIIAMAKPRKQKLALIVKKHIWTITCKESKINKICSRKKPFDTQLHEVKPKANCCHYLSIKCLHLCNRRTFAFCYFYYFCYYLQTKTQDLYKAGKANNNLNGITWSWISNNHYNKIFYWMHQIEFTTYF